MRRVGLQGLQVGSGSCAKELQLRLEPDVPVDVILEDQYCRQVLLNYARLTSGWFFIVSEIDLLSPRIPNQCWARGLSHVLSAFMCALQEPTFPFLILLFLESAGSTRSCTSEPSIPGTYSTVKFVRAAAREMASRRSVREGRLMTSIFWNYMCRATSKQT